MTERSALATSDKRALAIGGVLVVIVLVWFSWSMRANRLHDQIVDPGAPPAAAHGH